MGFYGGWTCLACLWSNESTSMLNSFSMMKPGCSGGGEGGGRLVVDYCSGVEACWVYKGDSVVIYYYLARANISSYYTPERGREFKFVFY